MRLLRQPLFLAISLSHFIVDVLNSQTGLLLAVLSAPLGLTNAAIGLIATLYAIVGALSQPIFGWLSDRYDGRWAAAGGVLWIAFFFSLVAVSPGYWPIVWLVIGSLGSAAFHPPGTSRAAQVGQQHMAGQAATAASLFFLFGQGGFSLGPAFGGAILDHLGRPGLMILTLAAVPIGLLTIWQWRLSTHPAAGPASTWRAPEATPGPRADWLAFTLLIALAGIRTWAQSATSTFTPKFFHDQGVSPTIYGLIVAVFMGGSAIGGVLGGVLGDRWGQRRTITLMMGLGVLPFYFLPLARGGWIYPVAMLAGLFNGAPHSVLVTLAQRALPGRSALASGITLGFMFTAGALGAYLSGLAADRLGLTLVLQGNAALVLLATLLSLTLQLGREGLRAEVAPDSPLPTGEGRGEGEMSVTELR